MLPVRHVARAGADGVSLKDFVRSMFWKSVGWGFIFALMAMLVSFTIVLLIIWQDYGRSYPAYNPPDPVYIAHPTKFSMAGCKPTVVAATLLLFRCPDDGSVRDIALEGIVTVPQSHELGKTATAFMKELVESGNDTRTISCSEPSGLATCWLGLTDLRLPLLYAGLAILPAKTSPATGLATDEQDLGAEDLLIEAQVAAKKSRRGIWWDISRWSTLGYEPDPVIWRVERDAGLSELEVTLASIFAGWLPTVLLAAQLGIAVGVGYWYLHTRDLKELRELEFCTINVERVIKNFEATLSLRQPINYEELISHREKIQSRAVILQSKLDRHFWKFPEPHFLNKISALDGTIDRIMGQCAMHSELNPNAVADLKQAVKEVLGEKA